MWIIPQFVATTQMQRPADQQFLRKMCMRYSTASITIAMFPCVIAPQRAADHSPLIRCIGARPPAAVSPALNLNTTSSSNARIRPSRCNYRTSVALHAGGRPPSRTRPRTGRTPRATAPPRRGTRRTRLARKPSDLWW